MDRFRITDHLEFDPRGRAYCPSCAAKKGRRPSQKSLALVPGTDGAYVCHAGCNSEEIREAIGIPKSRGRGKGSQQGGQKSCEPQPLPPGSNRASTALRVETPAGEICPEAMVKFRHRKLVFGADEVAAACRQWLKDRGLPWEAVKHFRLGVIESETLTGIQIPIPVGESPADGYLVKTRRYPFEREPRWSQKGVPAQIFWGHRAADPAWTILCEGEWDTMFLGWLVSQNGELRERYSVCCFTCGANSLPSAEILGQLQGRVAIIYDLDSAGRQGAAKVKEALGTRSLICRVPAPEDPPKGWDISDALSKGFGLGDILQAVEDAVSAPQSPVVPATPESTETSDDSPLERSRAGRVIDKLRRVLTGRLRFNGLTRRVELDGSPVQLESLYLDLIDQHDLAAGKDLVIDAVAWLARQNTYSPVVEYLDRCFQEHGESYLESFQTLAQRYLGTADPLYQSYVSKTLIAAVARAYRPGCKHDCALILQGEQGLGKSGFFRALAGEWFNDSLGSASDKDERLKLHSSWICEWAELEAIFRRKDLAETKAFLSCPTDNLRVPYGRTVEAFDRPSILVGTTNQSAFLSDPTGSRRFWVVPVEQAINLNLLTQERDRIWAAAVALFRAGEIWWLTEAEEKASSERNRDYKIEDPWEERILEWAAHKEEVTVREILSDLLQIETGRQTKGDQMRVAEILREAGRVKLKTRGKIVWKVKQLGVPGVPGIPNAYGQPNPARDTSGTPLSGIPEKNPPLPEPWVTPHRDTSSEVSLTETLTQQGLGTPGTPGIPLPMTRRKELNGFVPQENDKYPPGSWVQYRRSGGGTGQAKVIERPPDWSGSCEAGIFVEDGGGPLLIPVDRIVRRLWGSPEERKNA